MNNECHKSTDKCDFTLFVIPHEQNSTNHDAIWYLLWHEVFWYVELSQSDSSVETVCIFKSKNKEPA